MQFENEATNPATSIHHILCFAILTFWVCKFSAWKASASVSIRFPPAHPPSPFQSSLSASSQELNHSNPSNTPSRSHKSSRRGLPLLYWPTSFLHSPLSMVNEKQASLLSIVTGRRDLSSVVFEAVSALWPSLFGGLVIHLLHKVRCQQTSSVFSQSFPPLFSTPVFGSAAKHSTVDFMLFGARCCAVGRNPA